MRALACMQRRPAEAPFRSLAISFCTLLIFCAIGSPAAWAQTEPGGETESQPVKPAERPPAATVEQAKEEEVEVKEEEYVVIPNYDFANAPKINPIKDKLDDLAVFYCAGISHEIWAYPDDTGQDVYPPYFRRDANGNASGEIKFTNIINSCSHKIK